MSEMICGRCHKYGIYWAGLGGMEPHTYCPHCGGVNCQAAEESSNEEEKEEQEKPEEEVRK